MASSPLASVPLENIRYEQKGAIAYLTVDRPNGLNALNMATVDELHRALTAIRNNPEVRVILLTGAGEKAFHCRRRYQRTAPAGCRLR